MISNVESSIASAALQTDPVSLKKSSFASYAKNAADTLGGSLVAGWKGFCVSLVTSGVSFHLLDAVGLFRPSPELGVVLVTTSALFGTSRAIQHLIQNPSSDQDQKPTGKIQTVAKSVFQGAEDGAVTLGSGLITLFTAITTHRAAIYNELLLAAVPISILGPAVYSYLNQLKKESDQEQPPSTQNRLSSIFQALGKGILSFLSVCAIVELGGMLTPYHTRIKAEEAIVALSLMTALASSIEHYYSSSQAIDSKNRIRTKVINLLPVAYYSSGLIFLAGAIAKNLSIDLVDMGLGVLFSTALSIGAQSIFQVTKSKGTILTNKIAAATKWTFQSINSLFSNTYRKWQNTSKTNKLGIASLSMAALAYLSILYVGPENAYKTGQYLYYKTAFTEKTDVTTQSLGEWIRGYSDFEEMERLASLTENNDYQNFEDISCAEILQTCHLNATALAEHNKVYIQKALKFHPDKFNNCQAERTLAEKAMIALARAKEIIKADKECPGQDEDGCLKNEQEATITRILQQPTSYFGKLIGAIPTCFLHVEGQERPVETSMHYCKDMV